VTQFFQYHVGTINRKAIDLVAEDTKDFYFSSGKVQFVAAKVTGMTFSKDMQKASVQLETTQNMQVQQFSTMVTTPVVTNWKLEEGKWVFFLDVQMMARAATPMGESAAPAQGKLVAEPLTNPDGTLNIPKDFAEPERVAAQAQAILALAGTDKEAVTFIAGKAGEDVVNFHNGFNGQVSLQLTGDPRLPGLKITLDKPSLFAAEDAHIRIAYDPTAGGSLVATEYMLRLNLIPFNQEYPIRVRVTPPAGQ
jgi:hypothetical protein